MKTCFIVLTFLVIMLASCVPAVTPTPTATLMPTATDMAISLTPTPTEIPAPTLDLPSNVSTPLPIQPDVPDYVLTPDVVQVEHWKEYQTELARCVLADTQCLSAHPERALCEWDILGRSGQEIYVWAECRAINVAGRRPAVIHLKADGSIQAVEVPSYGSTWDSDIKRMFPASVQEKIILYIGDSIHPGRPEELRSHLTWREEHPGEPTLIVLIATPAP